MSLVIRHKSTGWYLRGPDQWTSEQRDALQFSSGLKLVDYLERGGIHENADAVEIVVCASLMGFAALSG